MYSPEDIKKFREYASIFEQNRELLEKLAEGFVHDTDTAKDIVSECFLTIWEKRENIKDPLPYAFKAVRNACLNYRRDDTRHKEIVEKVSEQEKGFAKYYTTIIEQNDGADIFASEIKDIFIKTLASMPEIDNKIFKMARIEGFSYKEIAEALGVSTKKVDKSIQKVSKELTKALSEYLALALPIIIDKFF